MLSYCNPNAFQALLDRTITVVDDYMNIRVLNLSQLLKTSVLKFYL